MSATATAARPVVICLGNDLRGDDGVALEVARLLRPHLPPHADLVESDGDPTAVIEAWTGRPLAVVVDAVVSAAAPGTVHHRTDLNVPASPRRSSHSLGLAEAVALGRALNRLPAALSFYGIEAADLTPGAPLTPPARAAAAQVADAIARALAAP